MNKLSSAAAPFATDSETFDVKCGVSGYSHNVACDSADECKSRYPNAPTSSASFPSSATTASFSSFDPESLIGTILRHSPSTTSLQPLLLKLTALLGSGSFSFVYAAATVTPVDSATDISSHTTSPPPDDQDEDLVGASSSFDPYPHHASPDTYAVKVLFKHALSSAQLRLQREEIDMLRRLEGCEGVVKEFGVVEEDEFVFIFMERCEEDLLDAITQGRVCAVQSLFYDLCDEMDMAECVREIFAQLCDAVKHCHQVGVYHRDIKPENILLTTPSAPSPHPPVLVKLADFGLATTHPFPMDFRVGSPAYISPESTKGAEPLHHWSGVGYDARCNDVWGCGVVWVNLIVGQNPWEEACATRDPMYARFCAWRDGPAAAAAAAASANGGRLELPPSPLRRGFGLSSACDNVLFRVFQEDPVKRCRLDELANLAASVERFVDPFWHPEDAETMLAESAAVAVGTTTTTISNISTAAPDSTPALFSAAAPLQRSRFRVFTGRLKGDDGVLVHGGCDVVVGDGRGGATTASVMSRSCFNETIGSVVATTKGGARRYHQQYQPRRQWRQQTDNYPLSSLSLSLSHHHFTGRGSSHHRDHHQHQHPHPMEIGASPSRMRSRTLSANKDWRPKHQDYSHHRHHLYQHYDYSRHNHQFGASPSPLKRLSFTNLSRLHDDSSISTSSELLEGSWRERSARSTSILVKNTVCCDGLAEKSWRDSSVPVNIPGAVVEPVATGTCVKAGGVTTTTFRVSSVPNVLDSRSRTAFVLSPSSFSSEPSLSPSSYPSLLLDDMNDCSTETRSFPRFGAIGKAQRQQHQIQHLSYASFSSCRPANVSLTMSSIILGLLQKGSDENDLKTWRKGSETDSGAAETIHAPDVEGTAVASKVVPVGGSASSALTWRLRQLERQQQVSVTSKEINAASTAAKVSFAGWLKRTGDRDVASTHSVTPGLGPRSKSARVRWATSDGYITFPGARGSSSSSSSSGGGGGGGGGGANGSDDVVDGAGAGAGSALGVVRGKSTASSSSYTPFESRASLATWWRRTSVTSGI